MYREPSTDGTDSLRSGRRSVIPPRLPSLDLRIRLAAFERPPTHVDLHGDGLQGMHGQRILLPRSRAEHPDPERLERRYRRFREAG